jgi:hypothetical protein
MVDVPGATPLTTPEPEFTVAFVPSLLAQVPPVVRSDRPIVWPTHTPPNPEIPDGNALTVTCAVIAQVVGNVNVIVVKPKPDTPVTTPVEPTVATPGLLLTHVPEPDASVKLVVLPWQTLSVPPIGSGKGLTVIR